MVIRTAFLLLACLIPGMYCLASVSGNGTLAHPDAIAVSSNNTAAAKDALNGSNATDADANSTVVIQRPDTHFHWYDHRDILPYEYAEVTGQPAPVYSAPLPDPGASRPLRRLDGGFIWVSLQTPTVFKTGSLSWYYINPGEYVLAEELTKRPVSTFKGLDFSTNTLKGSCGWVVLDTVTSKIPGKEEYIDGEYLDKHVLVRILETRLIKGKKWLKLGEKKWVDGSRVALIKKAARPDGIPPGVKWIDINLYEQVLQAYDGDLLVYATLVSSGLPEFETPTGLFRIWGKVRMAKMGGGEKGKDYYFLEDVPYHMYFHQGYAIHGAYWHDNFGIKQSHGCVNIAPRDAYWLFGWTTPRVKGAEWEKSRPSNPGTYVFVHY